MSEVTPVLAADKTSFEPDPCGQFIGSWRLISFEVVSSSGKSRKPFGDSPTGLLFYQQDGHMSAQLMQSDLALFASADPDQARVDEVELAWHKYVGYWGTFTVDRDSGVVTHHVEGGWFPNWIGGKQVRSFRFEEDHLTLSADLPDGQARLVWRKIG